jgi:hypothetical protein
LTGGRERSSAFPAPISACHKEKNIVPPKNRAADLTGRTRNQLQKDHEEEVQRREGELTTIANERERALSEDVVDLSNPSTPTVIDEVEEMPIGIDDEWVVFRTNEDLEEVTVGVGNVYSFRAGQKVRAPRHVFQNLDERGYVWH